MKRVYVHRFDGGGPFPSVFRDAYSGRPSLDLVRLHLFDSDEVDILLQFNFHLAFPTVVPMERTKRRAPFLT